MTINALCVCLFVYVICVHVVCMYVPLCLCLYVVCLYVLACVFVFSVSVCVLCVRMSLYTIHMSSNISKH